VKVLLVGGSFNPVHIGHLVTAQEVRIQFGYDLVLLVPSLRPPHKALDEDPGAGHRLAMLALAIGDDPTMAVDECEIRRGGTSYTIDTVRDLSERYAIDGKLGLLLGDDLIPGFPQWREPEILAGETDIVCAHRSALEPLRLDFPHRYANNPLVAISSSLIRSRAEAALPFRHLVPESVYDYIRQKGLYGVR